MATTVTSTTIEGKIKAEAKLFKKNNKDKFTSTAQTLKKGDKVSITKKYGSEYYYVYKNTKGTVGLWVKQKAVSKNSTATSIAKENKNDYASAKRSLSKSINNTDNTIGRLMVRTLNGIHGAPYQFMHTADAPVDKRIMFGRKYIERIMTRMPLLLMSPGTPDFMPSFTKNQRSNLIKTMVMGVGGAASSSAKSNLKVLLGKNSGRYYTFDFKYAEYYKYVNSMLRYCAVSLGIHKVTHCTIKTEDVADLHLLNESGKKMSKKKEPYKNKLGSFKWQKAVNFDISGGVNSYEYVAFYLDSETSISESLSNSTTEPALASSLTSSASSTSKELQFLLGGIAGKKVKAMDVEGYEGAKSDITRTINDKFGKGSSKLLNHLDEMFQTAGRGGQVTFPEIWDNSDFGRQYSVSLKLRTPDGDKISWFLNICVPLIHILALAAPRALGPNGYKSPYLVRAYYKGIFNCDMGMITGMNISKGKDAAWTADGLPTEVDVSIDIKDLYGMLTISNTSKKVTNFFRNTCLIDYLSNMCGININKPELARLSETYILFAKNKLQDSYGNAWLSLNEFTSNVYDNLYQRALFK